MSAHDRRSTLPPADSCPSCGKVRYRSRRVARTIARRFDRTLSAYPCCGGYWHLGHLASVVKSGEVDRRDLREAKQARLG